MESYPSQELVGSLISIEFNSTGRITQLWSADPSLPEEGEEFQFVLPPLAFNEETAEDYYPGTILIGARSSEDSPWIVSRNAPAAPPALFKDFEELEEVVPMTQVQFEYEFPLLPEIRATGTYYEQAAPIPQIIWEIELSNVSKSPIEIGELGFPLAFNNFYEGFGWSDEQLKTLWNNRLYLHQFIGGAGSWFFAQRMTAEAPGLLIFPGEETEWEYFSHVQGSLNTPYQWEGIPVVYAHSKAIIEREGWVNWVNPHTSLILQPGESKKYQMRFVATEHNRFDGIYHTLAACSHPAIRVLPGAVAPTNVGIGIEIGGCVPTRFECSRTDVTLETDSDESGGFCFVKPQENGPFEVTFEDTKGRKTRVHLMFIDPIDSLIQKRADFIEKFQFIQDERSPFAHAILLCNTRDRRLATQNSEYVGASGIESSLADALFLASKNSIYPSVTQIEILDTYIEDFLLNKIQNPASMSIAHRLDPSFKIGLFYGRPHIYCNAFNLYHQMYQIASTYGETKQTKEWYLLNAYKTAQAMFTSGWRNYVWTVGIPGFSRIYELLNDLALEGYSTEAEQLLSRVIQKAQILTQQTYPYAGESVLDTSGFEDIYTAGMFLSNEAHMERTSQCAFAARSLAPSWWWYGSDKRCWDGGDSTPQEALIDRGEVCLAHTTIPNSLVFFESLDKDYIALPEAHMRAAFGGMLAPWSLVRSDGAAAMCYTPDLQSQHYGYNPFTGASGLGYFMYLKSVGAYVLPNQNGDVYSFGCHFEQKDQHYRITPWDGVGQKIIIRQIDAEFYLNFGCIQEAKIAVDKRSFELKIYNPSDKEIKARLVFKGMWGRQFEVMGQTMINENGICNCEIILEAKKTNIITGSMVLL